MTSLPIVCSLTPAALRARREGLLADLRRRAAAREELPDGHRLRFAADDGILAVLAHAIDAERQCCRFLRFTLTVEPGEGPIVLDLTGPAGAREFVAAMLDE